MELELDAGDQDLLGFLLEESGDLGTAPDESVRAPLDWELPLSEVRWGSDWGKRGMSMRSGDGDRSRPVHWNPAQVPSDWEVDDLLSSLLSPPASSLNVLSNSNPCLVHHDHTYSLPREPVSMDLG